MNIKEIDSSKLLFDIHAEDLYDKFCERFPEFKEYQGKIDPTKVIKYIIFMGDLKSPFLVEQQDFFQRKYAVAASVKFPMSKKQFTEEAEQIIIGHNRVVNATLVEYIFSFGRPEYALLMTFMSLMASESQKAFAGKGTKDTATTLEKIAAKIQTLSRDFFSAGGQDEYSLIRQALYEKIEKERIKLRPEQIIRTLESEGSLPSDWSPYGDEYSVDLEKDLTFIGDK